MGGEDRDGGVAGYNIFGISEPRVDIEEASWTNQNCKKDQKTKF